MPVTKRMAIHAQGGKGLSNCYNYITNENKTERGHLVSSQNCSVNFAINEFMENARQYHKDTDDRVGYHIIQSFDPQDELSPEQANEIGLELCKKLYPRFQCVVSTHVDKGHVHNHILVNAVNLDGRKLNDRLADEKEGLMALRIYSDKIAAAHGCHVLETKPIGKYKNKNYEYQPSRSGSAQLKLLIDQIKEETNSLTELLERLSLEGYQIKRGKHLAVKGPGMERYRRLSKLGENYTEEALRQFFQTKTFNGVPEELKIPSLKSSTRFQLQSGERLSNESIGIQKASSLLHNDDYCPRFYSSRYKAQKELSRLSKLFVQMNELGIREAGDLDLKIQQTKAELDDELIVYADLKSRVTNYSEVEEAAEVFIKTFSVWQKWNELQSDSADAFEVPDLVAEHLEASEYLETNDLKEVKDLLNSVRTAKRDANHSLARTSFLKSRMTDLERLRGLVLENSGYVKRISFSSKMIDMDRSSESQLCVRIPYTQEFLYINRDQVVWSRYEERANFYMVDDQQYDLVDINDHPVRSVYGDQLDQISRDSHDRIHEYYAAQKQKDQERFK